jgi:hypothetical protein
VAAMCSKCGWMLMSSDFLVSVLHWTAKIVFKNMIRMNGCTDMNETCMSCVKSAYVD